MTNELQFNILTFFNPKELICNGRIIEEKTPG